MRREPPKQSASRDRVLVVWLVTGFVLTVLTCLASAMPRIEDHLTARTQSALSAARLDGFEIQFSGREGELWATGAANTPAGRDNRQLAENLARSTPGVRTIKLRYAPTAPGSVAVEASNPLVSDVAVITETVVMPDPNRAPTDAEPTDPTIADAAQPDAAQPEAVWPDAAQPAATQPDAAQPDAATSVVVATNSTDASGTFAAQQAAINAVLGGGIQWSWFRTGSSRLTRRGRTTMRRVAKTLAADPSYSVRIESHTDSWGREKRNLELSKKRAKSVKAYLAANGVAGGRMTAVGHGESRPVADNRRRRGRALNRRIAIIVLARAEGVR